MQTDLAGIVAKGFSLEDLREIAGAFGGDGEFEALVRRKDLAQLGLPACRKRRSIVCDLFDVIYQYAPAVDVLAQSHFIFTLVWGVCRLLVQVSSLSFLHSSLTTSIDGSTVVALLPSSCLHKNGLHGGVRQGARSNAVLWTPPAATLRPPRLSFELTNQSHARLRSPEITTCYPRRPRTSFDVS